MISPTLSNVFLHYVLDAWFEQEVKPRMRGRAFLIRYADDAVLGFTHEADARRVLAVLPKRFGKYGLSLHPEKTKLVEFQRPSHVSGSKDQRAGKRLETFDLLGFTHFWSLSRKGNWIVKRKTASDRFTRAVRAVTEWCRRNRHLPISLQHKTLSRKLRGHCAYYGITGNSYALSRFREEVRRVWHKWLGRRKRGNRPTRNWYDQLDRRCRLPSVTTVHSVCRYRSESLT